MNNSQSIHISIVSIAIPHRTLKREAVIRFNIMQKIDIDF